MDARFVELLQPYDQIAVTDCPDTCSEPAPAAMLVDRNFSEAGADDRIKSRADFGRSTTADRGNVYADSHDSVTTVLGNTKWRGFDDQRHPGLITALSCLGGGDQGIIIASGLRRVWRF